MNATGFKKAIAVFSCVILLGSLLSVGAVAANVLEIRSDTDVLHLALTDVYVPSYSSLPYGVSAEDLVVSFSNEDIVRRLHYGTDTEYRMIAAGQTEMTVKTANGRYSDRLTIVVEPAIPMTDDRVMVYTNARYTSRCLAYTPRRDGVYKLSFALPSPSLHFTEVYDTEFQQIGTPSGDETVRLVGGQTYYFHPIADGDVVGNAFEFRAEYIGETVEEPTPSFLRFARDEITMMLYDVISFPAYTFEPGGLQWYDSVTYTVDNDSIVYIDYDEGTIEALSAGTVWITATADTWGWSDTIRVTVIDEMREVYMDEPLPLTVYDGDYLSVMFTAPATGTYAFYSVTDGEGDPVGGISDVTSGEALALGDDENGTDFVMTASLRKWQRVWILVASYSEELHFDLVVTTATAATGVELYFPEALSQRDDIYYVKSGVIGEPAARFLGGPTAEIESYEISAGSYDVNEDEYGAYYLEAGEAVTFSVMTDNGLTDTIVAVAIDLLPGDLNFDGDVGPADIATLFYTVNGMETPPAPTYGAMELTGDNRVTLADAARLFYYVNGVLKSI